MFPQQTRMFVFYLIVVCKNVEDSTVTVQWPILTHGVDFSDFIPRLWTLTVVTLTLFSSHSTWQLESRSIKISRTFSQGLFPHHETKCIVVNLCSSYLFEEPLRWTLWRRNSKHWTTGMLCLELRQYLFTRFFWDLPVDW